MFYRFSEDRLSAFFDAHPLAENGRAYIAEALKGPSRKVQGGTRNAISNNPCPKMGLAFDAESDTAEARAVLNCVFDPDVVAYSVQPPRLSLDYTPPGGKRIRTTTPPDLIVLRMSAGLCIEEWKTADQRDCLANKRPGRYVSVPGGVSSPCADVSARELGGSYTVRFSDEIPTIRTLSQRYLLSYLNRAAASRYEPIAHLVTDYFREYAYGTLDDLLELEGVDLDLVHFCIATGRLSIDWDNVELSSRDYLIFRDQYALQAYRIATGDSLRLRKDNAIPRMPLATMAIVPGAKILADGVSYAIRYVGNTLVVGVSDTGDAIDLFWTDINRLNSRGLLTVLNQKRVAGDEQSKSALWRANETQINAAIWRREILDKFRSGIPVEQIEGASARSVSRWVAAEREAQASGQPPIVGLIDSKPLRGFHGPHIDLELSDMIDAAILEGLEKKIKPTNNQLFYHIKKQIEAAGHPMISLPAFYKRIKKLKTIASIQKSEGHKVSYQEEPVYWQLEHETPVHCQRPFELVHIDHTLLDLYPISMISGEPRTRVWLTVIMDAFSRRVLGYWLTYRPPSTFSTLMAIYDMFKRFGRIPDAVVTDWGSDFRSKAMALVMQALNIRHLFRPKSAARYGAVLERLFGSVHTRLIHNLAGNTKATKKVRTLTRAVDPKLHAGLFLYDIYDALEEFFFKIYDSCAHPALLRPPNEVFNDGLILSGARPHQLVDVNEILPILLPDVRGGKRAVDDRRGVVVNYERYGGRELTDRRLRGKNIPVKLVPFNPGCVLAFINGEWQFIESKFAGEYADLPQPLLRTIYEDFLMDQRFVAAEKAKSSEELTVLIEHLNEIALKNKDFAKDPDFKKHFDFAFSLPSDADSSSSLGPEAPGEHQRIAEMAAKAVEFARASAYGEVHR